MKKALYFYSVKKGENGVQEVIADLNEWLMNEKDCELIDYRVNTIPNLNGDSDICLFAVIDDKNNIL